MKNQLARFPALRLSRLWAVGLSLVLLSAFALADTIKLKNGSIIKGKVTGFSQGEFTVVLDLGTSSRRSSTKMVIAAEDIESIEFDGAGTSGLSSSVEELRGSNVAREIPSESARPKEEAPRQEVETPAPPARTTSIATDPESSTSAGEGSGESSGLAVIAEKETRVAAAADWTNTNIRVQKGQRIAIQATGEIDIGKSKRTGPGGIEMSDPGKLLEDRPTGALIAVIGDDNNDFIFVGRQAEFTAAHSGFLYLSVNERELKDNTGSFLARVKVLGIK